MIKDYVPARTSISTGIVVKQHLLERNKYVEHFNKVINWKFVESNFIQEKVRIKL